MNNDSNLLASLILEAQTSDAEETPSELLDMLFLEENPLQSANEIDAGNRLFDALAKQFGFIRHVRASGHEPSPIDRERWIALLRWLIRELREWDIKNDAKLQRLTALFITACHSDFEDNIWSLLPVEIEGNKPLLNAVEKLIASCGCDLSVPESIHVPIWEREAVESFKKADEKMDWLSISDLLKSFENRMLPNFFLEQAVRLLFRFGFNQLVDAVLNTRALDAIQVAGALTDEQKFRLGIASKNPYIQFGCAYKALQWNKTRLSEIETLLLSELLLLASHDESHWKKWMQVFNRYPVRFPIMQKALGKALAASSESALTEYVESISLSTDYTEGRTLVAECLREFCHQSDRGHRQILWRVAYKRWDEWNFREGDKDAHLFKIYGCELDYAIVAFTLECMTGEEIEDAMEKVRGKLQTIEQYWFRDISDLKTVWNRYLSQFQPFAHAAHVIVTPSDWLVMDRQYRPYKDDDNYLKIMMS